jgi:inhibitor of cysteine peptidase
MHVVLAAGVALAVAGCSQSGPAALGEGDNGTAITAQAGQQLVVELPSNPTTGFMWVVAESGPLAQKGEAAYESPAKPGVVGAGGTETFTFTAEKSGTGTLKLEYRRPWEKDVAAEDVWSVTVTVE